MMFIDSFNINLMCSFYMPGITLILLFGMSSILVVIIQQNRSDIRIIYSSRLISGEFEIQFQDLLFTLGAGANWILEFYYVTFSECWFPN